MSLIEFRRPGYPLRQDPPSLEKSLNQHKTFECWYCDCGGALTSRSLLVSASEELSGRRQKPNTSRSRTEFDNAGNFFWSFQKWVIRSCLECLEGDTVPSDDDWSDTLTRACTNTGAQLSGGRTVILRISTSNCVKHISATREERFPAL